MTAAAPARPAALPAAWPARPDRRYRRAVRRAVRSVTFYREQCAAAGALLDQARPTPAGELPDPPHTLVPFGRPWSAAREPSLWTPRPAALARALRLAGCGGGRPVLEVRPALLDSTRLPRGAPLPGRRYAVLLSPAAVVASPQRRAELTAAALAVAGDGPVWLVAAPEELAELAVELGGSTAPAGRFRPVHRLPVAAAVRAGPGERPVLLHELALGYLGGLVPACRELHLDRRRVHPRVRDGRLTLSLLRQRRPTLLDIVPPGAEAVGVAGCPRHGTPVLRPRR